MMICDKTMFLAAISLIVVNASGGGCPCQDLSLKIQQLIFNKRGAWHQGQMVRPLRTLRIKMVELRPLEEQKRNFERELKVLNDKNQIRQKKGELRSIEQKINKLQIEIERASDTVSKLKECEFRESPIAFVHAIGDSLNSHSFSLDTVSLALSISICNLLIFCSMERNSPFFCLI
jgi:hypothetical protein